MGQQNMIYNGPMLDVEPQQVQHRPEQPCMVSYGGVTCFPPPYNILPPLGNFDPRYLPENHGQLPYMITQYNGEHCNTFMIPVPINHNHFPFSNHHLFERNRSLFFPNMGIHGYQVAEMSRNSTAFMHPPLNIGPHQGPHNVYHPPPPMLPPIPLVQAQNMDIHVQMVSTLHRHFTSTYPFMNGVDPGPRFVGPTPPTGLRIYDDRRELMIDSTSRHHSFPHLSLLPEEGVSILDISDYHEVGHLVDHHNNMRLDIDQMSYEELLVLGEQIGNVDSSLSDNFISDHLKTKTFILKDSVPADEEPNFCVICQMEFEDQEKIGMLDCCHEYHVECIKKWLIVKNNCPICKSKALA